jgi:hypothetical protein
MSGSSHAKATLSSQPGGNGDQQFVVFQHPQGGFFQAPVGGMQIPQVGGMQMPQVGGMQMPQAGGMQMPLVAGVGMSNLGGVQQMAGTGMQMPRVAGMPSLAGAVVQPVAGMQMLQVAAGVPPVAGAGAGITSLAEMQHEATAPASSAVRQLLQQQQQQQFMVQAPTGAFSMAMAPPLAPCVQTYMMAVPPQTVGPDGKTHEGKPFLIAMPPGIGGAGGMQVVQAVVGHGGVGLAPTASSSTATGATLQTVTPPPTTQAARETVSLMAPAISAAARPASAPTSAVALTTISTSIPLQQHQPNYGGTTTGGKAKAAPGGDISKIVTTGTVSETKKASNAGVECGNTCDKQVTNGKAVMARTIVPPPPPPRHPPKGAANPLDLLASLSASKKLKSTLDDATATGEKAGKVGASGAMVATHQAAEHQALLVQQQTALKQLLAQQANMMQQANMVQQQQRSNMMQQQALSSQLPAHAVQQRSSMMPQQQQASMLQQQALSSHLPAQTIQPQQQQMPFMSYAGFAPSLFQGGVGTATNSGMAHLMQTPQGAVGYSPAPFQGGALTMPGASNGFASMPSILPSAPLSHPGRLSTAQPIGLFNNGVGVNMEAAVSQQMQMHQIVEAQLAATKAAKAVSQKSIHLNVTTDHQHAQPNANSPVLSRTPRTATAPRLAAFSAQAVAAATVAASPGAESLFWGTMPTR